MLAKFSIILCFYALCLPWLLIAARLFAGRPSLDRLLLGLSGGLAGTITLAYALAAFSLLDVYWLVYIAILPTAIWSIRGGLHLDWPSPWLLCALSLVVVAEAIPVFASDFPHGWDPAFHSILAYKILHSGALAADWMPFEPVAVNYTQGLHVLAALLSRWSAQPVHLSLQVLHLVIQPLAALWVYRLAWHFFATERPALLSLLTYALLCHFGSFNSYFQWGGLPTQIGSVLFLASVWVALSSKEKKYGAVFILLYGSLCIVHHLSALIATWVLLVYLAMAQFTSTDALNKRKISRLLLLTVLVYAPYLLPYATRVVSLGATDTLSYAHDTFKNGWQILIDLGPSAALLGGAGLVLAMRRLPHQDRKFLLCWLAALALGFFLLGYVYRFIAQIIWGQDLTAFTPSRFLTVASYPLAIYAGYALHCAIESLARRTALRPEWLMAGVFAAITLAAIPDVRKLAALQTVTPAGYALGYSLQASVPAGAFLICDPALQARIGPIEWLSYITWRATSYTPLPATEDKTSSRDKIRIMQDLDPVEISRWIGQGGRQGFVASLQQDGKVNVRPMQR